MHKMFCLQNCQKIYCGKHTHVPNLVVATTVCEFCGTRCEKCNKFDNKEQCFETLPCHDTSGFREVMFSGEYTKQDFGKRLFSPCHKDFTVYAHKAKAYDNYFLIESLIDNSIRPDIIYNRSKIMYMHVKRRLHIKMLDSVNVLPMK